VTSFLLPSIFHKYSFCFFSVAHLDFSKNSSMIVAIMVGAGCGWTWEVSYWIYFS